MKNVLGEALTLSNAGNCRETYRNAVGMYQQMNVAKKKPSWCMSHYLWHLCSWDKESCSANTKWSPQSDALNWVEEPAAYSLPLYCQFIKNVKAAVQLISSVSVLRSYSLV